MYEMSLYQTIISVLWDTCTCSGSEVLKCTKVNVLCLVMKVVLTKKKKKSEMSVLVWSNTCSLKMGRKMKKKKILFFFPENVHHWFAHVISTITTNQIEKLRVHIKRSHIRLQYRVFHLESTLKVANNIMITKRHERKSGNKNYSDINQTCR